MANIVYCSDTKLLNTNYYFALSTSPACNLTNLPVSQTGIANSGASGFYFAPDAPVANLNPLAPIVGVRVATSLPERSVVSATLASAPSLLPAAMQGHVMPSFPHTLIGLGPFASPRRLCPSSIQMDIPYLMDSSSKMAPASGAFHSKPPSQACRCLRHVKIMRNRAHAEALPIFSSRPQPPPSRGQLALLCQPRTPILLWLT
jgi:hypothetical protein